MNTLLAVARHGAAHAIFILVLLAGCQSASEEVIPQDAQAHARKGYEDDEKEKKDKSKNCHDGRCQDCERRYYSGNGSYEKEYRCYYCSADYYWGGECQDCQKKDYDFQKGFCKRKWEYKSKYDWGKS